MMALEGKANVRHVELLVLIGSFGLVVAVVLVYRAVAGSRFTLPVSYSELFNTRWRRKGFTNHFFVIERADIVSTDAGTPNP